MSMHIEPNSLNNHRNKKMLETIEFTHAVYVQYTRILFCKPHGIDIQRVPNSLERFQAAKRHWKCAPWPQVTTTNLMKDEG
jgi:hypothetical protein